MQTLVITGKKPAVISEHTRQGCILKAMYRGYSQEEILYKAYWSKPVKEKDFVCRKCGNHDFRLKCTQGET